MSGPADAPTDFASDNHAGAHPEVLEAIAAANAGHAGAYGADPWTARAEALVAEHFGGDARAFFVFNGTGANVASVDALTRPFEAVICTDVAHMHMDECAAPERLAGVKLLTVAAPRRQAQPRRRRGSGTRAGATSTRRSPRSSRSPSRPSWARSTASTRCGRSPTPRTRAGMRVHVDGARLANAAAALGVSLGELTAGAGVDVVSFGGTKNGLLFGEAVVFCDPELAATSSSPASSSASCRRRCASSSPSSRPC